MSMQSPPSPPTHPCRHLPPPPPLLPDPVPFAPLDPLLLKRLVASHRSHAALSLFAAALRRSYSSASSSATLPCLIKASAQLEAAPEGKQLHGLALKLGRASDPFVGSSLVSFYAKCGDLGSASKAFDRIPCKDPVAWNSLIDGCAKSGAIGAARKLFDEMPQRDLFSWTSLINGYSKCGEVDAARELFDRMPVRNAVSWNAMISGYMRNRDFASARRLFDEMPMRNLVTWNSMISGLEKLGLFSEALDVYDAMPRENLVPNTVTLVSALSAVSGLALLQRGKAIHTHVRQNGFSLDGVLGVCLIEMYSKCGSINSALSVFKGIRRKKVGHWTAMITGLGMHGMAGHAIKLFGEMQGAGFKPNSVTFVGVLNGCSHAGMVEEGWWYFELMRTNYDIRPTVEHYGCLVDLLCRVGRLEEARDVINRMPMKPNKVIWMSLLSGCRKYGNIGLGKYAAENVIELAPDVSGCYVLLSNIYASAGRWDEVSKLRELMKERGVRKDPGCSAVEYGGIVHEFIVGDRSHPQSEEIYCKLNEMGTKLKSAGYVPDTSQVLLCVEDKDKEVELARHSERLAIAFGLINVKAGVPIRVVKNLRVCNDCHSATKLLSAIYGREIVVRDNSRFHHFKDGACSCMDYW